MAYAKVIETIKTRKRTSRSRTQTFPNGWISTTDSSFEHQNILDVTKVGNDYSQCGQWLLDGIEYGEWRDGRGRRIFWLRGAGELAHSRH